MAHFSSTFYSESLTRKIPFTAIIPTRKELETYHGKLVSEFNEPKRTVYLLHGWNGTNEDWVLNARVNELAREYNLAFILPSGENSFYVDHPNGNNYGELIGTELVETSRELFPLSTKREHTWIAGLSMGGYGALRNGFKYSDTFSKVAAFSSRVLSKRNAPNREKLNERISDNHLKAIIESDTLADLRPENDIYELALQREKDQGLFLACGLSDYLYEENRALHNFLSNHNIEHEYFETPGEHTWDFWNEYIQKAVEWMVNKK